LFLRRWAGTAARFRRHLNAEAGTRADNSDCTFFVIAYLLEERRTVMNVSIGDKWESFVESAVQSGRYSSASEVIREGLRLVEEREVKLLALRDTLKASIDAGGEASEANIDAALEAKASELAKEGY
jgi:antitoxin ParD1/3/4